MTAEQRNQFYKLQVEKMQEVIDFQHRDLEKATGRKWPKPPTFDFDDFNN